QRQSFDRGCKPTIVLIDGDVGCEGFGIASSRLPTHALRPDLSGTDSTAAETPDADRKVRAPRLFRRSREVTVRIDQCRIEMQAGIEKRRMQSGLAIDGEMRRQPNSGQDLAVAPLQRLDRAKGWAIFESQGA